MIKRIIRKIFSLGKTIEPHYLKYVENNEESILRPGFSMRLDNPIADKKYLVLGKNSLVSCNIVFESETGKVTIGDRCLITGSTIICKDEVIFENHVFLSWGCTICDHNFHSINHLDRRGDFDLVLNNVQTYQNMNTEKNWSIVATKPIRVCSDSWIGMNCTILKGVTIGKGAIVAANSVVTKDVPDFCIVAGNPAQVVKVLDGSVNKNNIQ